MALPQGTSTLFSGRTLLLLIVSSLTSAAKGGETKEASQEPIITLTDKEIVESSGLAISRRRKDRYWTHNDSGDGPRLFAFDTKGRKTGQCRLPQATSIDWEDMASYVDQGTARLLVADCGDNDANRKSFFLYLFDEPDPDSVTQIDRFTKLELRYADGPQNCEAVAVDIKRRELILLGKSALPLAGLYRMPLPQRETESVVHARTTIARSKTLVLPMVTAMDVDQQNGDIWVGTYFDLFCFSCSERTQPIDQQLSALPRHFAMPQLKQIEAIAVDSEHQVHITSEGKPARMTHVVTDNRP